MNINMNEIKIKIGKQIYFLTNLNNTEKYYRAKQSAGKSTGQKQILAYYDKLAGYIQDQNGNKIENGQFWKKEQEKMIRQQKRKNKLDKFVKHSKIFAKWFFGIISPLVVIYLAYKFGWNK